MRTKDLSRCKSLGGNPFLILSQKSKWQVRHVRTRANRYGRIFLVVHPYARMCERQNNLAALEAGFEEVGHSGSRHSMLVPMRRWELAHHVLLRWQRLSANWRKVVATAAEHGVPIPTFASALAYYDGYRCARLPQNLLQAQRDYFGAHTYERTDEPREKFFHIDWPESERVELAT